MQRTIKVLSICTSDSSGGAAIAAYRIHLAVKKYGISSKMLVRDKKTEDEDVLEVGQFIPSNPLYRTFDLFYNKIGNKIQHYQWGRYPNRLPYFMSDLRASNTGGALKRIDYDLLHLHWINLQFFPLEQLPKDKPIVWTLHDSWPFCGICHYFLDCQKYTSGCGKCPHLNSTKSNDLSKTVWNRKHSLYRHLNLHIVTPSKWLGECASNSLLFKDYPISVVPNCLEPDTFRPLLGEQICPRIQELKSRFSGKSIILFGAVNASSDRIKGASLFLDALKYLDSIGLSEFLGVIVFGANKPLLGIPPRITTYQLGFISDTEEIVSLYNIASVVAVPSITEVFGQVASEAMSCGKPVVAFRCTGIQDVVSDDCGYLAEPYSPEDFANGIIWCLRNNKDGHLSENARNKVMSSFTPDVIGGLYSTIYRGIV